MFLRMISSSEDRNTKSGLWKMATSPKGTVQGSVGQSEEINQKIGILHYVRATTKYFFGSKRLQGWFLAKSAPKCLYDGGVEVKSYLGNAQIHNV